MNKWVIYEMLKGNRIPDNIAEVIEKTDTKELKEAVIEYLLVKKRGLYD